MDYKAKRPAGRWLLLTILIVSLIWMLAIREKPSQETVVASIPVIQPTPHAPLDLTSVLSEEPVYQELNIDIQSGDTLAKRLAQQHISSQTIHQLLSDPVAAPYLTKIFPGQTLTLSLDTEGELKKLEQKINETQLLVVEHNEGNYKGE